MKVIFVASGNKRVGAVSSFVQSQYDSLEKEGLEMRLFPVVGHGAMAHVKAAWKLRKLVRKEHPDIIHAHYSVCGYVAWLSCLCLRRKPKIVVSVLGSFPKYKQKKLKLVRYCVQKLWGATIVKSNRTAGQLGLPVNIIPNGVNLEVFHPMDYDDARKSVGFEENTKYVIWCSNPDRKEKNWPLAETAMESVKCKVESVELVAVYDKTPEEVCTFMNAADCLLLTSDSEGSPNVIKEAMACNCPIVTTNVGDVNERLVNLDGCYIAHSEELRVKSEELANAIEKALAFGKRTEGRKRLLEDKLEISQIAKRLIEVYDKVES